MKVYKIKHLPTGLFYTPNKGSGNLSIKGKIYQQKPLLSWCKTIRIQKWSANSRLFKTLEAYFKLPDTGYIDKYVQTDLSDWEIIEL